MSFTIAKLAKAADVHVETIRYYQRLGLVAQPAREYGSIRRYTTADADQLRFIKRAQRVGFTLQEVSSLLALRSHTCCSATRTMAATKLEIIEQRLEELEHLRVELKQWISDCDANTDDTDCPVIEHLQSQT